MALILRGATRPLPSRALRPRARAPARRPANRRRLRCGRGRGVHTRQRRHGVYGIVAQQSNAVTRTNAHACTRALRSMRLRVRMWKQQREAAVGARVRVRARCTRRMRVRANTLARRRIDDELVRAKARRGTRRASHARARARAPTHTRCARRSRGSCPARASRPNMRNESIIDFRNRPLPNTLRRFASASTRSSASPPPTRPGLGTASCRCPPPPPLPPASRSFFIPTRASARALSRASGADTQSHSRWCPPPT